MLLSSRMRGKMKQSRKDWIKNITIIFLAIMLVLTFFSNTIMNYSLPEVATSMVEPGTVTSKIRGTGTLEADDPYKVTLQESRVIASVAVKEGDVVEKDQVLFYLEDKESAELKEAEKKLDEMVLAYTTSLLAGEVSQQSYENIQSGNISSTGNYQARINAAKTKLESAQATVDSLARQIAIADVGSGSSGDKTAELENAKAALASAESSMSSASGSLSEAKARAEALGEESVLTQAKQDKEKAEAEKKAIYEEAFKQFKSAFEAGLLEPGSKTVEDLTTKTNWQEYLGQLQTDYIENAEKFDGTQKENTNSLLASLKAAYEQYLAAKAERETAEKQLAEKYSLNSQIPKLEKAYNNAKNRYNECNALVQSLTNEISSNTANRTKQKEDLSKAKIDADAALERAKKELEQLLKDVDKELNLSSQSSSISEQRREVERLREKSVGSTIVAPVAGTITSISKTAGETTVPEEAIVVMQPEGKGYSMSFSVTNDQAKKVSVGDVAELQNSWYYEDVKATLTAIRPDTQNAGQKKLLYFSVEGEVQAGQSISLSVGQRSGNYDMIVPNSAIREDSNGKFILTVESKNSPLGNRYVATRVDVEVLASDDLNTAINAALYGYEYVVTTANKPVEAGKQVRLADE